MRRQEACNEIRSHHGVKRTISTLISNLMHIMCMESSLNKSNHTEDEFHRGNVSSNNLLAERKIALINAK